MRTFLLRNALWDICLMYSGIWEMNVLLMPLVLLKLFTTKMWFRQNCWYIAENILNVSPSKFFPDLYRPRTQWINRQYVSSMGWVITLLSPDVIMILFPDANMQVSAVISGLPKTWYTLSILYNLVEYECYFFDKDLSTGDGHIYRNPTPYVVKGVCCNL